MATSQPNKRIFWGTIARGDQTPIIQVSFSSKALRDECTSLAKCVGQCYASNAIDKPNAIHFSSIDEFKTYINGGERHLAKNQRNKDTSEHRVLYTCIQCGKGYGCNSDMAFINFTDENHVCQNCHKESI